MTPVDLLRREAGSLVRRLRLWTSQRWAAAAAPGRSRADLAHHLAQSLADLEGTAPTALPRLDSDLALPDQVAVTADDLARSAPADAVARAATAHLLLHRHDLLGDDVPDGLARALGYSSPGAVLQAGQSACSVAKGSARSSAAGP